MMTNNVDNPNSDLPDLAGTHPALQKPEGAAAELARRMKEREQFLKASKAGDGVAPPAKPRGRKPLFGT
jgi:hypothetical protein